jgi:uncharacterized membrane protein YdjX (TVP38/TMEM64 family)
MKMPPKRRLLFRAVTSPALYLIVGLLCLGAITAYWVASIGGPTAFRESFGATAPLITLPIHVVLATTAFPADLIAVANGALYGLVLGTALSWLGWWLAALLQFRLGCRVRHDFDLESNLDRIPGWLRRFPVDHPAFLIGVRQLPWLGMHIGSFVPGAAGVGFRRFLWCSAIGVGPGSFLMAAVGAGLVTL